MSYIRSITDILPNEVSSLSFDSSTPTPSNVSSNTNYFSDFSFSTWIIIILLLALLGINIFAYLAKGTEDIADFFAPLLKLFGYTALTTTKQTIQTAATGTKAGVDIVADTATGTIDTITGQDQQNNYQQDSLNRTLNDSVQNVNNVVPNESRSVGKSVTGKAGWCFIGEENGIRTCSEVGVNDTCMSGDIFPTQSICVNPNLRT
jgi:hypothetical protein